MHAKNLYRMMVKRTFPYNLSCHDGLKNGLLINTEQFPIYCMCWSRQKLERDEYLHSPTLEDLLVGSQLVKWCYHHLVRENPVVKSLMLIQCILNSKTEASVHIYLLGDLLEDRAIYNLKWTNAYGSNLYKIDSSEGIVTSFWIPNPMPVHNKYPICICKLGK